MSAVIFPTYLLQILWNNLEAIMCPLSCYPICLLSLLNVNRKQKSFTKVAIVLVLTLPLLILHHTLQQLTYILQLLSVPVTDFSMLATRTPPHFAGGLPLVTAVPALSPPCPDRPCRLPQ